MAALCMLELVGWKPLPGTNFIEHLVCIGDCREVIHQALRKGFRLV